MAAGEEMALRVRIHVAGGSSGTADLLASVQVRNMLILTQYVDLYEWFCAACWEGRILSQ